MSDVHQHRQVAESFGAGAEQYDRARPAYPEPMIERVVAASPGPEFLDVGTGTGIAARQFRAAGCHVLGLDVDERMAAQARRHGLEVEVAKFEDWHTDRTFDTVVAAMTWHWIDPIAGAARAARLLRQSGQVALMWNVFEADEKLKNDFAAINARFVPEFAVAGSGPTKMVDAYQAIFDRAIDGLDRTGSFTTPEQWRLDWEHVYTRDEWLDVLPTFGGIGGRLKPEALAGLLAATGEVIDAAGGAVPVHYSTVTVSAKRA